MKVLTPQFLRHAAFLPLALLLHSSTLAQTTATWNNASGDNNWNAATNWDIGVPAEGTNAVIGLGSTVLYASPMAATSFAGLNNSGTLDISAAGFNIDAAGLPAYTGQSGSLLRINSSGVFAATNSGSVALNTGSEIAIEGGALVFTNSSGTITFGQNGNNSGAGFTNNGGKVIFDMPFQSRGRFSRFAMHGGSLDLRGGGGIFEGNNDQERQFLIDGGVANLGDFSIARTLNGVSQAGLVISNGVVNATSLLIGTANAAAGTTVAGGILTNTGLFTICDRANGATSGNRRIHFYVRGGSVYSSDPAGIIVANQSNSGSAAASIIGGNLDISSGLLMAEGITLIKDTSLMNAHATLTLAGTGEISLGPVGLIGNVGVSGTSYTMNLNGGILGAKDDFSIVGNGTLSGTFTIKSADLAGTPHNITHTGVWGGSGGLVKTGAGMLTLENNNTYSGTTLVQAGTLALGPNGSISNSPAVTLAGGVVLDVSARAGYVFGSNRILTGFGNVRGDFSAAPAATLNPGSNTINGTLTFSNALSEAGDVINHFDLSSNPAGPDNDLMIVTGDLNVSGVNSIEIAGGGGAGSVHPLIKYGGTFNGTLGNFALAGANGSLSNNTSAKTIYLVVESAVRTPTNIVWVGNATVNDWDLLNATNWSNHGKLDAFVTGDHVLFDSTGAAHPIVNVVGNVSPALIVVDATNDYAFTGSGSITGNGGLTKTNSGKLIVSGEHTYTGPTVISGGVLEAAKLANGGFPSSVGGSTAASANLLLDGATLRYTGDTVTSDRGATLNANGGTVDVASNSTALTLNGNVMGDGSLTKMGEGTLALGGNNTYTNGVTVGGGTFQLNSASAAGSGGVTVNGAALKVGVGGTVTIANTMHFNGDCTIDLNNVSGDAHFDGAWSGSGIVNVINQQNSGRTFTIGGNGSGGGTMHEFSGTINMGSNPGSLRFNDGGGSPNLGSTNVTIDLGSGTAVLTVRNGGVTIDLGELRGGANTVIRGRASGSSGTVIYSIGARNSDSTYEGSILDSTVAGNLTAINKVGTGKLTLTGSSSYSGPTAIYDGELRVDGALTASPTVAVIGGVLSGSGSISGFVDIQAGATLSVGDGIPGQMTITGALTFGGGSTNLVEVNKSDGVVDNVAGLSSVSYAGSLVISMVQGTLQSGDSLKLFDATPGNYFGQFDAIIPETPGNGLRWDTSGLTVDGTLKVVPVGASIASFAFDGSNLSASGSGGIAFTEYQVLSSTNVASPVSTWETNTTSFFDGSGNFNFTTPVDLSAPRRFFILQFQSP